MLAMMAAGTPTNLLPALGGNLVRVSFALPPQAKALPSDGYRTQFTRGGQLGGANRHIIGGAGATLSFLPLLYHQVLLDALEFASSTGEAHDEDRAEIQGDVAGLKAGLYMAWASVTGDAAGARTAITRNNCR
jgi:hypothetical protein